IPCERYLIVARPIIRLAPGNPVRTVTLVAALLCVNGCGLDAYEKELKKEQERIKEFDEAEQVLGNPVEVAARVGGPKTDKVFFRAPWVFAQRPDAVIDGVLYHYPRSATSASAGGSVNRSLTMQ